MKKTMFRIPFCFWITFTIAGCAAYQEKGMFREYQGIYAMAEPTDIALYRALLPQEFSMPEQPMVAIFIVDYTEVAPWPLTPYKEAGIFLKSRYANEEGWYVKDMPVTKWISMQGGRHLGFPKYVADEIILQETASGWHGQVNHQKKNLLSLEFLAGETGNLTESTKKIMLDTFFMTGAIHMLVPPGQGPTIQKITAEHAVSPQWATPVLGMVKVTIDPAEAWAGLFPTQAYAVFNHYKGGMNMIPHRLN
jgi:hypothetical protein